MNNTKKFDRKEELLAVLGLFLVTVIWGFGFVSLKLCEAFPTFILNAIRFFLASGILGIFFHKRLKNINKELVVVAVLAGIFIFLTYTAATIGIRYTTASRAAFFSCMEALFVPIINLVLFRIIPGVKAVVCVCICGLGIFLISMGSGSFDGYWLGDFISIFASIFFAAEIVLLARHGHDHDPIAITILLLFTVAILALAMAIITGESVPENIELSNIFHLVFLGLGASGIAFILQTVALNHISAQKGSLILTLEPVLGAFFTAVCLNDYLGARGYIGGALVFLAIVLQESNIGQKRTEKDE